MTDEDIRALRPALTRFLGRFKDFFARKPTFAHLGTYCRGLMSDLARKSVEPIALQCGTAVRTLQQFLSSHVWDHDGLLKKMQQHIVNEHLPTPSDGTQKRDELGVIGILDETSQAKKGDKTPGVQRQYCGSVGKIENCVVSVHLAVKHGPFMAMLDSDLFIPDESWDQDRRRCEQAHIPQTITYRSKWVMGLEQYDRAVANGVRFDWMIFDEWYGGKPEFLFCLEDRGQNYVAEVPANFMCWTRKPKYRSLQRPYVAKRVDKTARYATKFRQQKWRRIKLKRETMPPQTWEVKAQQVHLARDGKPTDRTYWLIVARNIATGETKYFISNAPPKTALTTLLKVGFCRWNIEHAFRVAKTEIGFGHYEGRNWQGLLRHMILCQLMLLFIAEQTTRLRGKKSRPHYGTGRPGHEPAVPPLAGTTKRTDRYDSRSRSDSVSSATKSPVTGIANEVDGEAVVAL
jgi:SRSO17 transposase